MMSAWRTAASGDVMLVHGCCHNPTGADLDIAQWAAIADLVVERGLFPFVDIAYQGFGEGLEADAAGFRLLAARVPEMVVASTCSKKFAVYRDRAGAALMMGRKDREADVAIGPDARRWHAAMYSMPPDHGAAVGTYRARRRDAPCRWKSELEEMRVRMLRLRRQFAEALRRQSNSDRFDFVAAIGACFRASRQTEEVRRLREEHGNLYGRRQPHQRRRPTRGQA